MASLPKRLVSEFTGTAFLVAGVVGSGIMATNLTRDVGLQLLANTLATVGVLAALILALGPTSGAHFNPAVSLYERLQGSLTTSETASYWLAQITGGIVGTVAANVMFELDAVSIATKDRSGLAQILSEGIATFGLLMVIFGVVADGQGRLAAATVAGYIGGAYWFTSSTSFANPAVTIARMFSDTFTGIDPANAVGFVAAQVVATALGAVVLGWLFAPRSNGSVD